MASPSPVGTYSYSRADLACTITAMDDFFRVYGTDTIAMGMFGPDQGSSRGAPAVFTCNPLNLTIVSVGSGCDCEEIRRQ